jgi:hypothetical protein
MKITKSIDKVKQLENNKSIANKWCDKCPNCGTTSSFGIESSWCTGLFRMKHWKKNHYTCFKCGVEYESEPYEYFYE